MQKLQQIVDCLCMIDLTKFSEQSDKLHQPLKIRCNIELAFLITSLSMKIKGINITIIENKSIQIKIIQLQNSLKLH